MFTSINGNIVPATEATVSVKDRGFRYGDGVFETILVREGIPLHFEKHLKRLKDGLRALYIKANTEHLHAECLRLIAKNQVADCVLRIAISRGVGGRGYRPPANAEPTVIIECLALPDATANPLEGLRLQVSSYQKISPRALPVQSKMMQGLNSTLASLEAERQGYDDAILLNETAEICETSSANIFWLQGNQLHTPALDCGVLAGITRGIICENWPNGMQEGHYILNDILQAESIFITSAIKGVQAVSELTTAHGTKCFDSQPTAKQAMQLWEDAHVYYLREHKT